MTSYGQLYVPRIIVFTICVAAFFLSFNVTISNIALLTAAFTSLLLAGQFKLTSVKLSALPAVIFVFFLLSLIISTNKAEALDWLELGSSFLYVPLIFFLLTILARTKRRQFFYPSSAAYADFVL